MVNWGDDHPQAREWAMISEVEPGGVKHVVAARAVVDAGTLAFYDEHDQLLYAVAALFWTSVRRIR